MIEQTCPECGQNLVRDIRPTTINFKGRSATFDVPGLYCTGCGEGIISGKDMGVYDKALNKLKAQAEGLLLPEEIRSIRRKLRLTQAEASALLGGGPNAFQKYESGIGLPSRAISNLLRILLEDPEKLTVLRLNATPQNTTEDIRRTGTLERSSTHKKHELAATRL